MAQPSLENIGKTADSQKNVPGHDNLEQVRAATYSESAQALADAKRLQTVAADQLSPERDPIFASEYYRHPKPMTTSIDAEMTKLNRDPKRLDAAIQAMLHHPKDGLNVSVTGGPNKTDVTFEIPGTEHYTTQSHRSHVLGAQDEANLQRMIGSMKGLPEPLSYTGLRTLANTLKRYESNSGALDRMLTPLSYELSWQNHDRQGIGLMFNADKVTGVNAPDALMAYGNTSPTYFHVDGRITRGDLK